MEPNDRWSIRNRMMMMEPSMSPRAMREMMDMMGRGFSSFDDEEPTEAEKALGADTLTAVKKMAKPVAPVKEVKKDDSAKLLKELGFSKAASEVETFANLRMLENMAALAGYTRISRAEYDAADAALRERTRGTLRLSITAPKDYKGVPPREVLTEMQKATKAGIFESFGIIAVEKVPDPILVGFIKGTRDMFYIAEWGDDISLQELVG